MSNQTSWHERNSHNVSNPCPPSQIPPPHSSRACCPPCPTCPQCTPLTALAPMSTTPPQAHHATTSTSGMPTMPTKPAMLTFTLTATSTPTPASTPKLTPCANSHAHIPGTSFSPTNEIHPSNNFHSRPFFTCWRHRDDSRGVGLWEASRS